MDAIELFAGAGGLALATSAEGFEHRLVVERDTAACATLRLNQAAGSGLTSSWKIFEGDVREVAYDAVQGPISLVAGGPPCQPFSLGGKHAGFHDDRNMFPSATHAISALRPVAFVFENVPGLLRASFRPYFEYIKLQLAFPDLSMKAGEDWREHFRRLRNHAESPSTASLYEVRHALLNAADFGVPQLRKRVFLVGIRSDLGVAWTPPEPTHCETELLYSKWISGEYWKRHRVPTTHIPPIGRTRSKVERIKERGERLFATPLQPWRTIRDGLKGLPDPRSSEASKFEDHVFNDGARAYPGHTGSELDAPSKTLKAGDHGVPGGENMIAYPDGTFRYLTVREAARIQTFPDEFVFRTAWTVGMRQLGNAVPVALGRAVVGSIRELLVATGEDSGERECGRKAI